MRYIVTIESDPCIHGAVLKLECECKENGRKLMVNNKFAKEFDNEKDANEFAQYVYMNDDKFLYLVV